MTQKKSDKKEDDETLSLSEKIFYIGIIIAIFAGIYGVYHWSRPQAPVTKQYEETYNGFVFELVDGVWVTQWRGTNAIYELAFRYHPSDLEEVPVTYGDSITFNNLRGNPPKIYVTFDPLGPNESFSYITFANSELSRNFVDFMQTNVSVKCTRQHESVCPNEGDIVRCDSNNDTDKAIVFFDYSPGPEVIAKNNCVILRGEGEEIIKATERFLYGNIFRIMDK